VASNSPALVTPGVMVFRSQATRDGDIRESSETSSVGGTVNGSGWTTSYLNVGDSNTDQQYRAIVSFYTAGLPDNATFTKVTLRLRHCGGIWNTLVWTTHGYVAVDIRSGFFGAGPVLGLDDFNAPRHAAAGLVTSTLDGALFHNSVLNSAAWPYINKTGTTQFRLRFQLTDDDDQYQDLAWFCSGDYTDVAWRPQLRVEYTTP